MSEYLFECLRKQKRKLLKNVRKTVVIIKVIHFNISDTRIHRIKKGEKWSYLKEGMPELYENQINNDVRNKW